MKENSLKNLIASRGFRVALLIIIVTALFLRWGAEIIHSRNEAKNIISESKIPPAGIALNDTKGTVPGNLDNGIESFKRLYPVYQAYLAKHNGKYPASMNDIAKAVIAKPADYGFKSFDDFLQYFNNPDHRYSDDTTIREAKAAMTFIMDNKRSDGTDLSSPKPPGKHDVLAFTDLYVHQNTRQFPGQRSSVNPVGYYLVLWDNGQVDKVPYDQVLFVPKGEGLFAYAFPGQAGVPGSALNYDDYWVNVGHWKTAPRGRPNGPGLTYTSSNRS